VKDKSKTTKPAKKEAPRVPLDARPRTDIDIDALADDISDRLSKSLTRLAK
jgi:hypothetical protein